MRDEKCKFVEKDGTLFRCIPVRSNSNQVGYGPVRDYQGYDDLNQQYTKDEIAKYAIRMIRTDCKNEVRAFCTKDKFSASDVVKAMADGTLTPELQDEAKALTETKGINFAEACGIVLGVTDDEPDPERIFWQFKK